ncbi:MAG: PepSY domain-containing protein [Marinilabiliaceae bacterium]|nr:PepSY domain-containing protein [Marinilabiliaceae bacterium]
MKKLLIQIHKTTGSLLSLLFLIWCFTGIILLFKGFPHSNRHDRFEKLEYLNEIDFANLPYFDDTNSGNIELEKYQGKLVYRKANGRKEQAVYDAHTLQPINNFTKAQAIYEAEKYVNAKVLKTDSINSIDSWIPWGYYKPLLPFYKCNMDDDKCSVIYISSKTGTVIQHTTRYSRWMARLGAIPHLMYFPQIKQNAKLWKNTILILGIIGILVTISGIIVAFFRFKRDRKRKIINITIYKKRSYKWHHIFGLFTGLFLFTFLLSGIFYATGVPSWISAKPAGKSPLSIWNQQITTNLNIHPKRIWQLIPEKKGLRKIAWSSSMGQPTIEVYYNDYNVSENYFIKNDTLIRLSTTEKEIKSYAIEKLGSANFTITIQDKYDRYYKSSGMYFHSLPAYKISFDNKFNTVLYIDTQSGKAVEYLHNNKKAEQWLTRGLHKLNFSIFHNIEWLRKTILIILCLGGLVVSVTGIILSWKWLKREIKNKQL